MEKQPQIMLEQKVSFCKPTRVPHCCKTWLLPGLSRPSLYINSHDSLCENLMLVGDFLKCMIVSPPTILFCVMI